jgi:hypothetical protein
MGAPNLSPFTLTHPTRSGRHNTAAMSPDARKICYTNRNEARYKQR